MRDKCIRNLTTHDIVSLDFVKSKEKHCIYDYQMVDA